MYTEKQEPELVTEKPADVDKEKARKGYEHQKAQEEAEEDLNMYKKRKKKVQDDLESLKYDIEERRKEKIKKVKKTKYYPELD
ncbi:MAG: hypothetical protein ACE5J7_01925 [Candidatus Aenigmatarchaeota archaeon]